MNVERMSGTNLLPEEMRHPASLLDIIGKGFYWLCPLFFTIAFCTSLYGPHVEPESAQLFIVCALLFGAIAAISILYPILRVREGNRAHVGSVEFKRRQLTGIYIPYSNTVHTIFKIMTPVMGLGTLALTLSAPNTEDRIKGAIGFAFYLALVAAYAWKGLRRKLGIVIAPEGVLCAGLIETYFIPWEALTEVATFMAKEHYSTSRAIGFRVNNYNPIEIGGSSASKLVQNTARQGFAVFAYGANILAPTEWIAQITNYYLSHPKGRAMLETEDAAKIQPESKEVCNS